MTKLTKRSRINVQPTRVSSTTRLIFKGVVVSLAVSLTCTLFLSLVNLITEDTFIDYYMQYVIVAVTMISIFIGSAYATQRAEHKGLIIGITIGMIYVLISVALGMKMSHESVALPVLANKMMAGIAAGALGGLIGVNLQ